MRPSGLTFAIGLLALIPTLTAAPAAAAEELAILLRTLDDPTVEADEAFCLDGPIRTNTFIGASAWSVVTRKQNGKVFYDRVRRVGTATACLAIIEPDFPVRSVIPLYGNFVLQQGTFVGRGGCTVTSNDIPVPGVVSAVCSASVTDAPPGFVGGVAGSATLLNPLQIPGVETGSYWSLRFFREPAGDD